MSATTSRLVARSPIYYGWVIWAVATLGCIATAPAQNFTVSLFIDHFIADLHLERSVVSGIYGLGTFIAALSLTWVGRQIDYYGNRTTGVIIASLFAGALVMMAFVSGPIMLLALCVATRGLGAGSLWLVHNTSVTQWFLSRRGQVMAILLVGFALFQAAWVPWMQNLLETMHWRQAWLLMAAGVAVIVVPLTLIFVRAAPENYGLKPDGGSAWWAARAFTIPKPEDNWTLREAMHTSVFWLFLFGRFISPLLGSGLTFHQLSLFRAVGHEASVTANVYSLMSILTAVVTLMSGSLVDRWKPGRIMAVQSGAMVITLLAASSMTTTPLLLVYAVGFAVVIGQASLFDAAVWANMYGRQYQGAIRGFVATVAVSGTALGPVLYGLCYDLTGNYDAILLIGAAVSLAITAISPFMRVPTQHPVLRNVQNTAPAVGD